MNVEAETRKHIMRVQEFLMKAITTVGSRMIGHDKSKLEDPEAKTFEEYTPKLSGTTYGSDEYKKYLEEMKPALKHHYQCNRHHPEHFQLGVQEMDLMDLLEMLCDWKAASERHADGDIRESIRKNTERFGLSPQLVSILTNTVNSMGW